MDLGGFEPPTSSVRLKRAPNCATGPYFLKTLFILPVSSDLSSDFEKFEKLVTIPGSAYYFGSAVCRDRGIIIFELVIQNNLFGRMGRSFFVCDYNYRELDSL